MIVSLDIQEKKIWQETSANIFINKFYLNEKLGAINVDEYEFENIFDKNEQIFQDIFQEIKKLNLDDISAIPKILPYVNLIKDKLDQNINEIQKRNDFFENKEQNNIQIYQKYLQYRVFLSFDSNFSEIYSSSLFQEK